MASWELQPQGCWLPWLIVPKCMLACLTIVARWKKEHDLLIDCVSYRCGHCKKLAPEFEKLGASFKKAKSVLIGKVRYECCKSFRLEFTFVYYFNQTTMFTWRYTEEWRVDVHTIFWKQTWQAILILIVWKHAL